jgi:negative regulator of flagellin synthesis FlgM
MRIDQINSIYETYKKQSASKVKPASKVEKKDEVALSSVAKDFQTVYKLLNTTPDIREDKVNSIKERMNSGTYNVKAEEVADKILSSLDIKG